MINYKEKYIKYKKKYLELKNKQIGGKDKKEEDVKLLTSEEVNEKLLTAYNSGILKSREKGQINLMLDEIPVPSIMRVTGHKTESAFWKYIKIEAKDSIKAITKLYSNK